MRCLLISDIIVVCAQCVLLIEHACVKALILSEKTLILSEKALILSEKALILSEKALILSEKALILSEKALILSEKWKNNENTNTHFRIYTLYSIQYNAVANWSRSVRQKNVL